MRYDFFSKWEEGAQSDQKNRDANFRYQYTLLGDRPGIKRKRILIIPPKIPEIEKKQLTFHENVV